MDVIQRGNLLGLGRATDFAGVQALALGLFGAQGFAVPLFVVGDNGVVPYGRF